MALANDKILEIENEHCGRTLEFVVTSGVTIYAGALVALTTGGLLTTASDTTLVVPVGVAMEGGTAGETVRVLTNIGVKLLKTSAAATDVGLPAYASADDTVKLTSTYYNYVGAVYKYYSTTHLWVWVDYNQNLLAMSVFALSDRVG